MKNKAERNPNIALLLALALVIAPLAAQQKPDPQAQSATQVTALEEHIDQMAARIESMRQELIDSRDEMRAMRAELEELRHIIGERDSREADAAAASLRANIEKLREDSEVLQAEVKQHDQTKIETESKFPVQISGSVLFTSLGNSGASDNVDAPTIAMAPPSSAPAGSLTATARQTILGLDANGPHFGSARTSAALSVDFFGGVPYAETTTAGGVLRLRTAHATLAWPDRAVTVAFDRPILSPREPTSWITLGEPALAWSGNLWTWAPQFEFRQEMSRGWYGELALIDPAAPEASALTGLRTLNSAERSRQPGYEAHLGNSIELGNRKLTWGTGGYLSRQSYPGDRHLDAWAGTVDWDIALASPLEISGTFYRGRGIGGLGGGAFKDYVPFDNYTRRKGLDDEGGWGQLKLRFSPVFEANVAAGVDNAFAGELRGSDYSTEQDAYQSLARNLTAYGNVVYRPYTYLLFSAEYRQIRSTPIEGSANQNHILGLAAGYLF